MHDLSKDNTHLYVKDLTQLLVDNTVVESTIDLTRQWYRPIKDSKPLIWKDKRWEHIPYFTYSNYAVIRDPLDGIVKCWYEDLELRKTGLAWGKGRWIGSCQCYAESRDGISWTKPELDVRTVDGKRTNIVYGGDERGEVHSANIVFDPHPPRLEERYRMLYTLMADVGDRIECAHSPDGIHWTPYNEPPAFGISRNQLDDASVIFYDEFSRCFVMNTRHQYQVAAFPLGLPEVGGKVHSLWQFQESYALRGRRKVYRTYSADFLHWSEPVLIADIDEDTDNIDSSLYGMSEMKIGTIRLGFCGMLHHVENTMDVHMLVSRDGIRWNRCYGGQPFLSPGGENAWDVYKVSIGSPPIEVGDEYWFFHGGSTCHHDWWYVASLEELDHPENRDPEAHAFYGLGRAVLRKDGFASLKSNRLRYGVLVTRPLITKGNHLNINARCAPGGWIRAEILDAKNEIVSGCVKESCDPYAGDSVAHRISWKGNSIIPDASAREPVRRIRFYLSDAEIFSFTFSVA